MHTLQQIAWIGDACIVPHRAALDTNVVAPRCDDLQAAAAPHHGQVIKASADGVASHRHPVGAKRGGDSHLFEGGSNCCIASVDGMITLANEPGVWTIFGDWEGLAVGGLGTVPSASIAFGNNTLGEFGLLSDAAASAPGFSTSTPAGAHLSLDIR